MRLFFCFLIACFFSFQSAGAQQEAPSQQTAQYDEWLTYYYFYKDVTKVNSFLQWLQDSQMLEKNEEIVQPIAAFFSIVFKENPQQVSKWVKNVRFTSKTKEVIERALWLSGNGKLITEIFKETPDFAKSNPSPLINMQLKDINDVAMMWDAFFASGDSAYVKKIIDILDDGAASGEKTPDMESRGFAEWTLGRYMIQHELVNRFVRKEINLRTGLVKEKLEAIVARANQVSATLPNTDGDFAAMLLITNEKGVSEFAKPFNEAPRPDTISKAKRGDTVAVKIRG